jgi:hypothetical protein
VIARLQKAERDLAHERQMSESPGYAASVAEREQREEERRRRGV